ncbi:MAG: hypothetical protein P8Y44_13760 [Acidobacteriota bacterium]
MHLEVDLQLILEMLQITPSAGSVVCAWWLTTAGAGAQYLDHFPTPVVGLALDQSNAESVAGCRPRNEDRNSLVPGETVASSDQLIHIYDQLVQLRQSLPGADPGGLWRLIVALLVGAQGVSSSFSQPHPRR